MTDIYNNTEAFGLMSDEKQAAMKEHNGPWALYVSPVWSQRDEPLWSPRSVYRAVRPVETPMTVASEVWRVLHPDVRWITSDGYGEFGWRRYPKQDYKWHDPVGIGIHLSGWLTPGLIDPGTCDWRKAIVERPKGGDA